MVYEIYYEPKGAVWRLRIVTVYCGLFAVSTTVCMKTPGEGASVSYVPIDFDTYGEAAEKVACIGLDQVYARRDRRGSFATVLNSVAVHATPA